MAIELKDITELRFYRAEQLLVQNALPSNPTFTQQYYLYYFEDIKSVGWCTYEGNNVGGNNSWQLRLVDSDGTVSSIVPRSGYNVRPPWLAIEHIINVVTKAMFQDTTKYTYYANYTTAGPTALTHAIYDLFVGNTSNNLSDRITSILEEIDVNGDYYTMWVSYTKLRQIKIVNYVAESFKLLFTAPCIPFEQWTDTEYEIWYRAIAFQILFMFEKGTLDENGFNQTDWTDDFLANAGGARVGILQIYKNTNQTIPTDGDYSKFTTALLEALCMTLDSGTFRVGLVRGNIQ